MSLDTWDSRRKRPVSPPPPMADTERIMTLKILGVTITSTLSISDHICEVIKSCAQTQYTLRIFHAHGLSDSQLCTVFKSVAIAKITYASTASFGFANKRNVQRIDATRNVDFVNQTFRYFKNCVTLQRISSSTKFYTISNTFSTTCILHLRLLHSPTTSGEDRIVSYFLNVLDTSRILTLLSACYTLSTFITQRQTDNFIV